MPGQGGPFQPEAIERALRRLAPEDGLAAVTREFIETRAALGRRVVGFCASEEFARASVEAGAAAAQITAEPEVDPLTYEPSGGSAKKLRAYARRLERAGVRGLALMPGEVASMPEFRASAEALVRAWKERARHTAAHILDLDPWQRAAEKRFNTMTRLAHVFGFLEGRSG